MQALSMRLYPQLANICTSDSEGVGIYVLSRVLTCVRVMKKTEWERDEPSFMPVAATALMRQPQGTQVKGL